MRPWSISLKAFYAVTLSLLVAPFGVYLQYGVPAPSAYFSHLLDGGIMIPPSQFEGMFVSLAHTEEDIERTIEASYNAMKKL